MDAVKKVEDTRKGAILRVIIYARVSTKGQKESGYGLDTQVRECREYAERMGFLVIAVLQEDISGMVPLGERPEGAKAISMLERGEADGILVHRADRFSRDMLDGLNYIRILLRLSARVFVANAGEVKSETDIKVVIDQWQADQDRKKIIENLKQGKHDKARGKDGNGGRVVGSGPTPYGFRVVRNEKGKVIAFEIVEAEARVIRMIYDWYVREGLKMLAIAKRLTDLRIPTPGDTHPRKVPYRPKLNRKGQPIEWQWNNRTICTILTKELYCGVYRYGKAIGQNGKDGIRPLDQQIAVKVPAIVDRATWQAAQVQLQENKASAMRHAYRDFMLRGHVRCGDCGGAVIGFTPNQGIRHYYRCRHAMDNERSRVHCKAKGVRVEEINAQVKGWLKARMENAGDLQELLREAQREEEEGLSPKQQQLDALLEQMAETEKEINQLADSLPRVPEGGKAEAHLLASLASKEELYARQTKKRDELRAGLDARQYTDENIDSMLQFREDFVTGLENPTNDAIRRSLTLLGLEVIIRDGKPYFEPIENRIPRDIAVARIIGQSDKGWRLYCNAAIPGSYGSLALWRNRLEQTNGNFG